MNVYTQRALLLKSTTNKRIMEINTIKMIKTFKDLLK